MNKILFFLAALLFGNWLNGQTLSGKSSADGWRLFYGPFDQNSPSDPDALMKFNWPSVPATVPGNVETDLFAAGKIQNPEIGNNIYELRKYEAYQWWYFRTFQTPASFKG